MTLKKLLTGLILTFAAPWLILIVGSHGSLVNLTPVEYKEDAGDEAKGYFPPALASAQTRGLDSYLANGCSQCHTQVIRPQYVGGDGDEFKKGWGEAQGSLAPARTRPTTPYDYLGEPFAAIGVRRFGPDLANAGYRFTTRVEVLNHLYNPQALKDWSICPPQPHLFEEQKIQGQRSDLAVTSFEEKDAPEDGHQIVPNAEAIALADYILALKRNHPLPVSLGGKKPAPAAPAAPAPAAQPAAAPAK